MQLSNVNMCDRKESLEGLTDDTSYPGCDEIDHCWI